MICLQILMIDTFMENITLLQTVKPSHKADIVYRLDSVVYFSTSIFFHFITQYEST